MELLQLLMPQAGRALRELPCSWSRYSSVCTSRSTSLLASSGLTSCAVHSTKVSAGLQPCALYSPAPTMWTTAPVRGLTACPLQSCCASY